MQHASDHRVIAQNGRTRLNRGVSALFRRQSFRSIDQYPLRKNREFWFATVAKVLEAQKYTRKVEKSAEAVGSLERRT